MSPALAGLFWTTSPPGKSLLDLLVDLPFRSWEWALLSDSSTSTSLCCCVFHIGHFVHFLLRAPQRQGLALHGCNCTVPGTRKHSEKFCCMLHTDNLPWAESKLDAHISSPFCEAAVPHLATCLQLQETVTRRHKNTPVGTAHGQPQGLCTFWSLCLESCSFSSSHSSKVS